MSKYFLITLIFISLQLRAATEDDDLSKYIGGAFGMSTGYGLSYRYWPEEWGGQVTFSPYWQNDEGMFNLGVSGFKRLYDSKNTRLFLYLASNGTYSYNMQEDDQKDGSEFGFTVGFGPGFEIYIFKHIALDIMFGYSFSYGKTFFDSSGVGFTAETGIYYRF